MPYYGPPINQPNNGLPFVPGQNENANNNYGQNAKKNTYDPNGDTGQTSDKNPPNPHKNGENTGDGGGEDAAHKWLREVIRAQPDKYDTGISDDVWLSWYPEWDDSKKKFKNQKQDGDGKPFTGDNAYTDKPTDCPPNTQAWGDSKCLKTDDQRLLQGNPGAQPAAPAAPVDDTSGTSGAPGEIAYTGNPMVDMLIYQFNNRHSLATGQQGYSNIFGMDQGRSPVAGSDPYGAPLGQPAITGKLLNGGGLWWGDANADLSGALSYGQSKPEQQAVASGGSGAGNKSGGTGNLGWIPAGSDVTGNNDVTGGSVNLPDQRAWSEGQSPLQKMLLGNQKQGAFGGLFS